MQEMPGSIVTAPAVEKGTPSEQVHVNGHESKAASREAIVSVPIENGKMQSINCETKAGEHQKENGHAPGCPAQAREEAEAKTKSRKVPMDSTDKPSNAAPDPDDESEQGASGTHGSGASDEKDSTPETTPAGSDRAGGSPSCPSSDSAQMKGDDESNVSASLASASHELVHSSSEATSSSAEASAKRSNAAAAESTLASSKGSEGGEDDHEGEGAAEVARKDRQPGNGVASTNRLASGSGASASGATELEKVQKKDASGAHAVASATQAAPSKPPVSHESKCEEILGDDVQLVASLIAAAADNTGHENGDSDMVDTAETSVVVRAFALSDCAISSSSAKTQEASTEDKLAMATLLGLAGVQRQKSEDESGSENGDDDDAASAPDSSTRPDAETDGDDMEEDSKSGKEAKSAKGPGKRGQKKKKDRDGAVDGKGDCDDLDDDADNDDADNTRSSRKAKKEADGDEPKHKGRKGRKQDLDASDRNLSREERKMQAIMRQFEQMEQKEKAKAAPCTPRPEGKGGDRGEKEDSVEVEACSSHRKRKDADEEEGGASARKKPKVEDDKATSSPRGTAESSLQASAKARGRPPNQKLTGKQKIMLEKEAGGALAALRCHKSSNDSPHPVRPGKPTASTPKPVLSNELSAALKCLRFAGGKKHYCWVQPALSDLSELDPDDKCSVDWLPSSQRARLNPHRRMIDKKRFPVIKSHLARWIYDSQVPETNSVCISHAVHVTSDVKVEVDAADVKMEEAAVGEIAVEEVKMEEAEVTPAAVEVKVEEKEVPLAAVKHEDAVDEGEIEKHREDAKSTPTESIPAPVVSAAPASLPSLPSLAPPTVPAPLAPPTTPAPLAPPAHPPQPTQPAPPPPASAHPLSKTEVRIPRREPQHGDLSDRSDSERHAPPTASFPHYPGPDRMRFRDAPGGQGITTGYGSLAITIPVGGSQHISQYGWDQRARSADTAPLAKTDTAGPDFVGNSEQRWQRGAESPGMWGGKREGAGPPPISLGGPNSPSKMGNAAAAANSWDRSRDRSEGRSSKSTSSDQDQDTRWPRSKDGAGHWNGKRDGPGPPPLPSPPRVGDPQGNWGPRCSSRTSAWDQPPVQGESREGSFPSKDGPLPDRDLDRSSAIRNLPDMREIRREPSPPSLRRRVPTPPRSLYGAELRDRGMDMGGGAGGSGGGLSRESLRREREDALLRDREVPEREVPPRFMRSEIVRSEIVRSEIRSSVPERASDSPRSRGIMNQWDLVPRARSPRPLDRPPLERPPMERPSERPVIGRAISPPGRDRSLSPRSKEVQREMQAAREQRRGGDGKDEWGRDIPESRRDGSECSPGPDDRDLPPRRMLGVPAGAGRGGWWGGASGPARGGGPGVDDRPPVSISRRQRPSMFAARRPREDGFNSPPRSR